ncbi:folylpolyglutamate synthase [Dichotomopilus funicola]|uniref:Folylpolyglutamate synthase n=1 Tax=Dichotomopilus funicola TaxID=1934379 RepID=A0AAN6V4M6_9PEZI|nr:folylpolyglutamate synthase [Dichotomopilus funicola]
MTPPSNPSTTQKDTDDDYALALDRLAQLQSNRAITALFEPKPITSTDSKNAGKPADLNALAIPEMLAWLQRAGYTPASLAADSPLRVVHVAGTKGKGSVSALVAGVLGEYPPAKVSSSSSGFGSEEELPAQVGLYTSPHVLSHRERIALNNTPISRAKFARYVNQVWDRLTDAARQEAALASSSSNPSSVSVPISESDLAGPATKPFYFRFLTLVALHAFVREGLTHAVVECGIGGEYDSTNIFAPESVTATVVTQLGLDHVGMLGDTVAKIAWHKSGVFKPGVKAFTRRLSGKDQQGVMEVLRQRARERGAELVEVGDEEVEKWGGVAGARLEGPFQKYNMALAVYAAREHLVRCGVEFEGRFGTDRWELGDIPEGFVRGLRKASLRGRCEVVREEVGDGNGAVVINWHVDGAHTDDSLAGVGKWFAERTRRVDGDGDGEGKTERVLVFNQQERDPGPLLKALLSGAGQGLFNHAIFTRNEETPPTGNGQVDLAKQTTAQQTMNEVDTTAHTSVQDSVQGTVEQVRRIAAEAEKNAKTCDVLVTGSFHLVGAVLRTIDHVEC